MELMKVVKLILDIKFIIIYIINDRLLNYYKIFVL